MEMSKIIKGNKIIGVIDNQIKHNTNINGNVMDELLNVCKNKKRVNDSLKLVGLSNDVLSKDFLELSSGEKQKVFLAKALLSKSKVIILENSTDFLDSNSKQNLIKLLNLMKMRYNKTIIIISHDIEFMYRIVDYVFIMEGENIIMEGNKYKIFSDSKILERYGLNMPLIIQFSNLVKQRKNIDIGYRDDINDLMKDIYRFADK